MIQKWLMQEIAKVRCTGANATFETLAPRVFRPQYAKDARIALDDMVKNGLLVFSREDGYVPTTKGLRA